MIGTFLMVRRPTCTDIGTGTAAGAALVVAHRSIACAWGFKTCILCMKVKHPVAAGVPHTSDSERLHRVEYVGGNLLAGGETGTARLRLSVS